MTVRLRYRVGTHSAFFAAMRRRLSSSGYPALARLTTRDTGDPLIAILDAWAVVGDVLAFYQERIANEGYLRTATERRSVLELARLVGYRRRPGVAAGVYLAYTIDMDAAPVEIPAGARVNSVPGPGEQMQSFETSERLQARAEWNELRLRLSQPQTSGSVLAKGLYLKGTATNLRPNDALLVDLAVSRGLEPFRVLAVEPDAAQDRTRVVLRAWTGDLPQLSLLRDTVRRLADVDRFTVARDSAMTKRVVAALTELEARGAAGDPAATADYLHEVLPRLSADLDTAVHNKWTRLAHWLEETVHDLESVQRLLPRRTHAGRARAGDDGVLPELLDRLGTPPSLPPRSARRLDRSVASTFAVGADIYPALLLSLRPSVRPVLYTALSNYGAAPATLITVYALRQAAPLFGHNAPREPQYEPTIIDTGELGMAPNPNGGNLKKQPWPEWELADEESDLASLNMDYPQMVGDTPVIVDRPASKNFPRPVVTTAKTVDTASRTAYGLAGKTTRIRFRDDWWNPPTDRDDDGVHDSFGTLRATTVFCQSERLELADEPLTDDVCGGEVELDRLYDGLRSGRWMILSGERADIPGTSGVHASELVMLSGVSQRVKTFERTDLRGNLVVEPLNGDSLHTFVTFAQPLAYCYKRDTVVLHGNVVHATHGETRHDVLGSGDAGKPLQTFVLKQRPLTYTSAATVSGAASTLEVRIDDVRWHEAGGLSGLTPTSRAYVTQQDDDGTTSVVFGDGERGARLPTGVENVKATYRNGIGSPGNARPGQISLLATKPLGVKAVVNPIQASGGADADDRDQARRNAPLAVMALDRLVSTQDYADFARLFAGIGKATAARLSDGHRQLVHVTVAGVGDIPIDVTSDLHRNLAEALHRFGDPHLPLRVEVRELLALVVAANVKVLPDHDWDLVEPVIRSVLLDVFGFERRELGQDVLVGEVVAAIQGVRGVEFVDLDTLDAIDEATVVARLAGDLTAPATLGLGRVVASPARLVDGVVRRAQLAYLSPRVPDSLILNEVQP
jgi:hypothetical protein